MVELPHVLVGAAIAAKIGNPALALPLAFASHFVLDLLPHTNPSIYSQVQSGRSLSWGTKKIIFLDSFIALVVGSLIASAFLPDIHTATVILLASFFAVLPDVLEIPYYFMQSRNSLMVRYVMFSRSLQNDVPVLPGTLSQVVVSAAALLWIFS